MACLDFSVLPVKKPDMTLTALPRLRLSVSKVSQPSAMTLTPQTRASVALAVQQRTKLSVAPLAGPRLMIGEVCSVSAGELYVLAASDGPLRTKDGGYFLLSPDDG